MKLEFKYCSYLDFFIKFCLLKMKTYVKILILKQKMKKFGRFIGHLLNIPIILNIKKCGK